jgi:hypothetical protein
MTPCKISTYWGHVHKVERLLQKNPLIYSTNLFLQMNDYMI